MKLRVNLDRAAVLFLPWMQLILWSLATLLILVWVIGSMIKGTIGLFGTTIGLALFGYFAYLNKGLVDELKDEYRRLDDDGND